METCKILKFLRKERNLTQEDLSKILKIGQATIACYENGTREPHILSLIAYANFFECSIDYLVGRSDDFGNVTIINGAESLPASEQTLLVTFRSLPPDLQRRASAYLAKLGELAEDEKTSTVQPRSKKGENLC